MVENASDSDSKNINPPGTVSVEYANEWGRVREIVEELQKECEIVNGTQNDPNYLFDKIDWYQIDELENQLNDIQRTENYEELE